jgi:hypothetical protein
MSTLETPFADRAIDRVHVPRYLWLELGEEAEETAHRTDLELKTHLAALGFLAILMAVLAIISTLS